MICTWCNHEMLDKTYQSCSGNLNVEFPDGSRMPSIPFLHEDESVHRCHDCYVVKGGCHHPGCDMEVCPKCEGQLISCGCLDTD